MEISIDFTTLEEANLIWRVLDEAITIRNATITAEQATEEEKRTAAAEAVTIANVRDNMVKS